MGGQFLTSHLSVAVILTGGLGTRLRETVPELPKSMAPVLGKPFLEHQLGLLARQGIRNFILCTGYKHEAIRGYFQEGSRWGWKIRYSIEESPLGTGGALGNARHLIPGVFLLLNGDTYLDIDFGAFTESHLARASKNNATGSIAVWEVANASSSGRVALDPDGKILSFREKVPDAGGPFLVNAGAYLFEKSFFRYVPESGCSSLESDVIPYALEKGAALYGYPIDGAFFDIGTRGGYERFLAFFGKEKPITGSG